MMKKKKMKEREERKKGIGGTLFLLRLSFIGTLKTSKRERKQTCC